MRTTGQYSSIIDLIRKLYRAEGWKVFYRGYLANSLGGKTEKIQCDRKREENMF